MALGVAIYAIPVLGILWVTAGRAPAAPQPVAKPDPRINKRFHMIAMTLANESEGGLTDLEMWQDAVTGDCFVVADSWHGLAITRVGIEACALGGKE